MVLYMEHEYLNWHHDFMQYGYQNTISNDKNAVFLTLTVPGFQRVGYFNLNGNFFEMKIDGFVSVLIQL